MTNLSTHVISAIELVALDVAQRTISAMLVQVWHMLQIQGNVGHCEPTPHTHYFCNTFVTLELTPKL
jgi:hypothetical protein